MTEYVEKNETYLNKGKCSRNFLTNSIIRKMEKDRITLRRAHYFWNRTYIDKKMGFLKRKTIGMIEYGLGYISPFIIIKTADSKLEDVVQHVVKELEEKKKCEKLRIEHIKVNNMKEGEEDRIETIIFRCVVLSLMLSSGILIISIFLYSI